MGKLRKPELTPPPLQYAAYVTIEDKVRAEQVLIGAMLREPFNLSQYVGQLNRTALSFASGDLAAAFLEIIDQYSQHGRYSAFTIRKQTGVDAAPFAARDTDVDLSWAVDNWWHEYTKWAESTAMAAGIAEAVNGADEMRDAQQREREKLGLMVADVSTDYVEQFMSWGADKVEGKETRFLTTPHTEEMRGFVKAFEPGEFWIVAARPGMGKTQFVLNTVSHFYDQGLKGLFISLEMSAEQLLRRMIGIRHGINPQGDWSTLDKKMVWDSVTEVAGMKDHVKILNRCNTITDVESEAMAAHYRGELQYIMLDYIQLVSASVGRGGNRNDEMTRVSGCLMRIARTLNIPVIALSQLSRDVEKRGGSKRPGLSDLRDSGAIEQDAHGVIFLYRPEYYGIMEDESGMSVKDTGEAIIAKQRNGALGTAYMRWNPIRGYTDKPNDGAFSSQFPVSEITKADNTPINIAAHRPSANDDIPF